MVLHLRHTIDPAIHISFSADEPTLLKGAQKLAEATGLSLHPVDTPFVSRLLYTTDGLKFQHHLDDDSRPAELFIDYNSPSLDYRRVHGGGIKQPLARAVGIKPGIRPTVFDLTAGLGIDAFILCCLGCRVTMIERSPVLSLLIDDGLDRARGSIELQSLLRDRLSIVNDDSITILSGLKTPPDTIYLDPMYPHRTKSALNKQEMRLIRFLVGDDEDADRLLDAALASGSRRVVVKRPKGAAELGGAKPSHVITMKNSRFDVYIRNRMPKDR
ncbi:MAG: class I SAM-dependent methyltransferase [Thermodesulfobacteriota bacterium]